MPSYRWVVIKYPDGHTVRTIVEEHDVYPELVRLAMMYGGKYRIGPRVNEVAATALKAARQQRRISARKLATPRPLSPDMGRGSGGPI